MSNIKRTAIISIAAIAGSQVMSLLTVQAVGQSNQAGDGCTYRWGDIGRQAERLGYQANLEIHNPGYPRYEPDEPRNVPISGNTASLPAAAHPIDMVDAVSPYPDAVALKDPSEMTPAEMQAEVLQSTGGY